MRALTLVVLLVGCGAPSRPAPPAAPVARAAPRPPRVELVFVGNHEVSTDDLPGAVTTGTDERALASDQLALQSLLWDRGYYESEVAQPLVDATPRGDVQITFPLREGKRFRFGEVVVRERAGDGAVPPLEGAREAKSGDWFSKTALAHDIARLQRVYRDAGYAFADVVPSASTHDDAAVVDLAIEVTRGPVIHIRAVVVHPVGATGIADEAKNEGVVAGARYSESRLERLKETLGRTGAAVSITYAKVKGHADLVDVQIERL